MWWSWSATDERTMRVKSSARRGFYIDVTEEFDADVRRSLDEVVAIIAVRRATINQAIGMLMLAHGLSADEAFEVLARRSQETNVKLRDLAAQFVKDVAATSRLGPGVATRLDDILSTATNASASPARASRRPATPAGPGHRRRRSPGP
jgi:ANTAR domain